MKTRKLIILGGLFGVGLLSYSGIILTDANVTLSSALLSLGTEGLKTAILFVLIDYLISDYERRFDEARLATEQIRSITSGKTGVLGELLKRTSPDGGPVKLDLSAGADYSKVELNGIEWEDSQWAGVDLSNSDFKSCRFSKISMTASDLSESVFENCIFKDVDFGDTDHSNSLFSSCEFMRCKMGIVQCTNARFSRCEFWVMDEVDSPSDRAIFSDCVGVRR